MTDATTIIAVSGAAVGIIGSLAAAAVTIIKALRETKAVVEATQAINQEQSGKLENIEHLVDGQYSAVLKALAEVKRELADVTGRRADRDGADAAERTSEAHAARVVAALGPKEI